MISGIRRLQAGAVAVAAFGALLALAIWASTACAAPLSMTFTEARANVGVQLAASDSEDALFRAPDTAPFDAQVGPDGAITAGAMAVPDFETFITDPIDAFVTVEFDIGAIGGSFNQATGALTLSGTAGGTLTSEGRSCTVSTTPAVLTLTTAGTTGGASPFSGDPFTRGLAGAGSIAGQWDDMHATPVTEDDEWFCGHVDARIGGPGGVWLEHEGEIAPPGRIAAGGYHSCTIKADDTPACWGNPAIPAGLGTVRQIAAGGSHTCAVKTDGTPACWGGPNDYGQRTLPVGIGAVRQITAGGSHTCAIKADRTPVCWGADDLGQSTLPAGIGAVKQIDAGEAHTCAVKADATPVCWGDDDFDQATIPAGVGTVSQIAAGGSHTCAVKTDGTPVCWGANDLGQRTVPAGVGTVTQIAAGGLHTCAIKTNGTPVCWGRNAPAGYPHPTLPLDIGAVTDIAAGDWHSCAIKTNGTPVCWGSHIQGQLGGSPVFASGPPPSVIGGGPFSHAYILAPRFDELPVRFLVGSGSLPPGLTLNETTGALTGMPTVEGTFTGTVIATNDVFDPETQAFSMTVDTTAPVAPGLVASTPASPSSNLKPRIVGAAEPGSTVRLYDNETCTGLPRATGGSGAFASPGLQITVAAGSTTTVYATATDAAGNTSECSTGSVTYANTEATPADPGAGIDVDGGDGQAGPTPEPAPRPRRCVVPRLAGKTLRQAKRALKAADCKLGKVQKPKQAKGKKRRLLVVKRSFPGRGAKPADRMVDLELRPKPKPKSKKLKKIRR